MRPRLGLDFDPRHPAEKLYADACGIVHTRQTCYVSLMTNQSDVDAFYLTMQAVRDQQRQTVVVFHSMPASDPYGDNLPQFIANVMAGVPGPGLLASSYAFNLASPTPVVIAVQPGNENNEQPFEGYYGPMLRGNNGGADPYTRGVSHGNTISQVRTALDNVGVSNVAVWTTGARLTTPSSDFTAFFNGVLDTAPTATAGLCLHSYSYPPLNGMSDYGALLQSVRQSHPSSSAKIYATEVGTQYLDESLNTTDPAQITTLENSADKDLTDTLSWASTAGTYFERTYWFSVSKNHTLLIEVPHFGTEPRCTGTRYQGLSPAPLCERKAGTTFRTYT
jgi:hypothetical protein